MASIGDWGQIIEEIEAERFVGREQELEFFQHHIKRIPPRYLIFYITGQGGVGKSTLLNRYREICRELDFLLADCDEQQKDIPAVLGRFAQQLNDQGHYLRRFNERYKTYRQKIDEIENDPRAPQGLAALLGRTVIRGVFIAGDLIPGLRKGLDYIPKETVETQASEWAEYLAKKLTNRDDFILIREPIPILTSLFFEDLNEIAQKQRVLLCFENFEVTRQELQGWFMHLLEYLPSQNIRMIIAGRGKLGAQWEPLQNVIATISLDVFTLQEAETLLDIYEINSAKRRSEILEWSGRLPVLMSWLAAPEGKEPDLSLPTNDIVERFLRWVTQPTLRQVALRGAIPLTFNLDILKPLLKNVAGPDQSIDSSVAFDWLQTMPFVKQHADGWRYHEVVRRMLLQYQLQKSPQTYQELHATMADFYSSQRKNLGLTNDEEWANTQWRNYTLSYVYHFLIADPIKHWAEVMNLYIMAIRNRRTYATELIELIYSNDIYNILSDDQKKTVQLFHQQLGAIKRGELKDGFEMFNLLCNITGLSSQAISYAFAFRGECYKMKDNLERAIDDFDNALNHIPEDTWILTLRGETYQELERYEEALADFDHALTLDEKNVDALIERGETYLRLERYEKALADFDHAIALNEKKNTAFIGRSLAYTELGRYQEALVDIEYFTNWRVETDRLAEGSSSKLSSLISSIITLEAQLCLQSRCYQEALSFINQALTLDEKNVNALTQRGKAYKRLERYEEALADLDQALALDEKNVDALTQRGMTYIQLERYEEALADLDQALALDEKNSKAFLSRSLIKVLIGHHQDALVDLEYTIPLNVNDIDIFIIRGKIYKLLSRYEEALADLDQALALDEKNVDALIERGKAYQWLGRYEEALADLDQALALDEKNVDALIERGETYQWLGRYEEALADFDHALALNKSVDRDIANLRGLVLSYIGRYAEAIENYNLRLKQDSDSYISLYNIAVAMMRWKGLSDAQQYIEEARSKLLTKIDTDERGSALYGLGGLQALANNSNQALDYLEEAIHLGEVTSVWARHDIAWLDLRTNPRFQLLISPTKDLSN